MNIDIQRRLYKRIDSDFLVAEKRDGRFYKGRREILSSYQTMLNPVKMKTYNEYLEDFIKQYPEKVEKYRKQYHSYANFIVLPAGLNYSRGRYNGDPEETCLWYEFGDFADLTLQVIKDYYHGTLDLNRYSEKVVNEIKYYEAWFKNYGHGTSGWQNFVDRSFLKGNFVNEDYSVHMLWEGHAYAEEAENDKKNGKPCSMRFQSPMHTPSSYSDFQSHIIACGRRSASCESTLPYFYYPKWRRLNILLYNFYRKRYECGERKSPLPVRIIKQ
jgi:hypothetical protein